MKLPPHHSRGWTTCGLRLRLISCRKFLRRCRVLVENPEKLKNEIELSGIVGFGEGRYSVELLITDDQNRSLPQALEITSLSKSWPTRCGSSQFEPRAVESVDRTILANLLLPEQRNFAADDFAGCRAHELVPKQFARLGPGVPHLKAFILWSGKHRTGRCDSLHFNLEQQRELFRSDQFDSTAFRALSRALNEIGASQRFGESPEEARLSRVSRGAGESGTGRGPSSDVIIFLGAELTHGQRIISRIALCGKPKGRSSHFLFRIFPLGRCTLPGFHRRLVTSRRRESLPGPHSLQLDQVDPKMLAQLDQSRFTAPTSGNSLTPASRSS